MAIKVTLAKAHQSQLDDVEIKKELCSVEAELNKVELPFQKDTINFVFIKGMYLNSEKKMLTACLFVNKMDKPITELHGVLRLGFKNRKAQIAKTTVDLGIPVKGLSEDENFVISDISGNFEDVRVTMN